VGLREELGNATLEPQGETDRREDQQAYRQGTGASNLNLMDTKYCDGSEVFRQSPPRAKEFSFMCGMDAKLRSAARRSISPFLCWPNSSVASSASVLATFPIATQQRIRKEQPLLMWRLDGGDRVELKPN
jgi:hypothetical protein